MEQKKKHAGGRPLKYKSLAEMQPLINAYFAETPDEELTITGLALALDTTREILCGYEGKDEFSAAVKKAKARVENSYERALRKNGRAGEIFALKNFGWRDQKEVKSESSVTIQGIPAAISEMITPNE